MKIIFIYEHFFPPFDDGVKKFAYILLQEMSKSHDATLIKDIGGIPGIINNLLTVPRILLAFLFLRPDRVVYVPKGALTFPSLARIWILEKVLRGKLSVVGVQRKKLSGWQHKTICKLKFNSRINLSFS